jgi:ribonuclease HI
MIEEESLEIYIDGSVSNKNGGVGIRILTIDSDGNEVFHDLQSTGYVNAKSSQMEIVACVYALEEAVRLQLIRAKKRATIFTDSKYLAENYKETMFHWVGNRWLMKSGRPAPDAREWKDLVKQIRMYNKLKIYVEIKWIKGHDQNQHNQAVHQMAKNASRVPISLLPKNNKILSAVQPKQLVASNKTEIGSVKMEMQKISIKILDCEYLSFHNLWSYKYLVVSKNSSYYGLVDKIFSKISLDVGRVYYVRFNLNTNNPRIEKLYREVL